MILWLLYWAVWLSPVAFLYWVVFRESPRKPTSPYSDPGWHFPLKRLWARWTVRRMKQQRAQRLSGVHAQQQRQSAGVMPTRYECRLEEPRRLITEDTVDSMLFHAADFDGGHIIIRVTRMRHCSARLAVQLKIGAAVYQLPQLPDSLVSTTSPGWCVGGDWGGLRVELVEPLRLWRISFNGVLREGPPRRNIDLTEPGILKHVRFSFIWTASSQPYNCRHDWGEGLLADTLAREPWQSGDWIDTIKTHVGGYDQWGNLQGQVLLEGEKEPRAWYLRGLRQRRWGPNEAGRLHRRVSVTGILSNGDMFSVSADCHPGLLSHASYGHVRNAVGELHSIQWTSLSLPELAETPEGIPHQFVLSFTAGGVNYTAGVYLPRRHGCTVFCERPWSYVMLLEPTECSLERQGRRLMEGVGLAEFCYRYSGDCPLTRPTPAAILREPEPSDRPDPPLVLHFPERECRCSAVVGGKGASLAALASLAAQSTGVQELFLVPRGFCLTVAALERQLERVPALREARAHLDAVACGRLKGDLQQECEHVSTLFAGTPVCADVRAEVAAALGRLSDTQIGELSSWAVRSSAVGEDSEELSAAGQNATFLGCEGEEGVLSGVQRCWGSLFGIESVTYRRQHGQPIANPMAVVVQRMVPARAAGVMFTCDPTSGDPRRAVITANHGLGESVVSAAVDPDTVVVERDPTGNMKITDRKCGSKKLKIVMAEGGGVRSETTPNTSGGQLCLSDEEVLRLSTVGSHLERAFGGPRDVEWAFIDTQPAKLCLLQARPVTALFKWSDYELLHETDFPIVSEQEVLTTANTGEVLPGASSVLTQSLIVRMLDLLVGESASGRPLTHFYNRFVCTTHHHGTLNVLNVMLQVSDESLSVNNKVAEIAVCGHSIVDDRILRAGLDRHGVASTLLKITSMWRMVVSAWKAHSDIEQAMALETTVAKDVKGAQSAREALDAIDRALPLLKKAANHHCLQSNVSVFSEIIAFFVLMEGQQELTMDHLTDVATMLSSSQGSDVESAKIPIAIKEMVRTIRAEANCEAFAALDPKCGLSWMQEYSSAAHGQLTRFLAEHGCRVVREFDLITVTWDMDPSALIASLQTLVKQPQKEESPQQVKASVQEVLKKLKSPQRMFTRLILSRLLPWLQRCVARREASKAVFMRTVHQFRLAFRQLGALMEAEGRLPSSGLVFYLSHWELHRLLNPRDPAQPVLLNKASRRQRRWTEWDNLAFPEVMHGLPTPHDFVQENSIRERGSVIVQASTASEGSVTGRACVVISLEGSQGISQLLPGDILITQSTDVGWSPYFPLLGGVVTELGGLISHGAVVAREYGLPCLIGAQGATKVTSCILMAPPEWLKK